MNVVVIDDERSVLDVLCEVLALEGYHTLGLDDPAGVREINVEGTRCLFLIDIMLPGTTGIQVAKELRAGSFGSSPMIAMSASQTMAQAAGSTGLFQDTLHKPFDLEALLTAVKRHERHIQA